MQHRLFPASATPSGSTQRPSHQPLGILPAPVGRTQETSDLAAVPADQEGCREPDGADGRGQPGRGVSVELELLDAGLFEKFLRGGRARPVDADRDDLRLVAEMPVVDGTVTARQLFALIDGLVAAAEEWQVVIDAHPSMRSLSRRGRRVA